MTEVWYRFVDRLYAASVDEFERFVGPPHVIVHLEKFLVLSHTPKGVWVAVSHCSPFEERRFVLCGARKRFACPTIEEARQSFIARKRRQIKIYRARIARAEESLDLVAGYEKEG